VVFVETMQAVVLGIVQGLTEFLPISSSGHLVMGQHLFGLKEPELVFDIGVHVGTLFAVCAYYRRDLLGMLRALLAAFAGRRRGRREADMRKLALLVVVGSLPTMLIGVGFQQAADRLFSSLTLVGSMLLVTGCALALTLPLQRSVSTGRKKAGGIASMGVKEALIIGTVQGLAILPGISRSGSTISAALFLGIERETAARYSFLLSIPAILGAALLMSMAVSEGPHLATGILLLGGLVSGLVGYGALWMLVRIVRNGKMYIFAPYCWLVGVAAICLG
jgi:undecaprenyl-diphosphatase